MPNLKQLLMSFVVALTACDLPSDAELARLEAEALADDDREPPSDDDDDAQDELPAELDLADRPHDPSKLINVAGDCYKDDNDVITCGWGSGGGGEGGGGGGGYECGPCIATTNLAKYPSGGREYCPGLGYLDCAP